MSRLNEIYKGWKNYIFPNTEIESLAKQRIEICADCESLNSLNICILCICPRAGKARSPESRCPANKWPDGRVEQYEPLKEIRADTAIPSYLWDEDRQEYILEESEINQ